MAQGGGDLGPVAVRAAAGGEIPQQVVTTTPRNVEVLKAILKNPSSVTTHAPTEANRAYLAASFLAEVEARFGGTLAGRQELQG
jgi:phage terminase large subunit-like protein